MYPRDIIVIGTSAGGIEALKRLVADLPADIPASIFVVQHCAPYSPSFLPRILERSGPLRARNPVNHELIKQGRIYVAPPDRHMLIQDGHVCTSQGPKENRSRPSIDALFRSAALTCGGRVIGVILTGMLDDGTAGLLAIKERGGLALVQNPDDAAYPSMPESALRHVTTDYCLPISEIAAKLVQLAQDPVAAQPNRSTKLEVEFRVSLGDMTAMEQLTAFGHLSPFTCPECQSALWELRDGDFVRFRCRMGHAHTAQALLAGQNETIENMLDSLRRARREQAELMSRLNTEHERSREALMRRARSELKKSSMEPAVAAAAAAS